MTTIDEATGLPALPEGMFWRINEHYVQVLKVGRWTEWEGTKRYSDPYKEVETRDVKLKTWVLPHIKTTKQYRVRVTQPVTHRGYGKRDDCGALIEEDPVTPENVVERCQEVLAAYNEKVKREALYGDYPPKKFEGA